MIYNNLTLPDTTGDVQNVCLYVYSGDTASDITVNSDGQLIVMEGKAANVVLNAGGTLEISAGTVSNLTVGKGASLNVSGGKVSNVTFKKGAVYGAFTFTADTKCTNLKTISNATVSYYCSVSSSDYSDVKTVSNVIICKGATLSVEDGGTATNVTLNKGGMLNVSGGKVSNVTFKKGAVYRDFTFTADTKCTSLNTISNVSVAYYCMVGAASFCDAKTLSNLAVNKGGSLVVQDGGKVTNVILNAGGSLQVDSGKVSNLTVNKGYSQLGIMDTGSVSNITFKKGAEYRSFIFTADTKCANLKAISNVTVTGSAFVGTINSYSDPVTVSNVTVGKDSFLSVEDGGKASNVTISKGGSQFVWGTGKASNVTINAGGELTAYYGGTVSGVTVKKGARLWSYNGAPMELDSGKASTVTVKKGGIVNGFVFAGDTTLKNLSKISNVTAETGKKLYLNSKQSVSNLTMNGEKTKLNVYGGTVTGATVGKGSNLQVKEDGKATNVTVMKGGKLGVEKGGQAKTVTVENGGWLELDDGKASAITVKKGGRLDVNDDGTFSSSASAVTVKKGGSVNGFTWAKDMTFKTFSKITDATVTSGSEAWVVGRQSASNLVISGKNTILAVESYGTANNITVNSGAELVMGSGGKVTNITVKKGGILNGISFKKETKYASSADFLNANLADNTDDTWKAASKQKATLSGKTITGWVGLKDAKDFIRIQIQKKGCLSLELDGSAKHAYEDGKIQFSLLNSSGKAIGLTDSGEGIDLVASSALKKGSICYLGISCTDAKNYYTDYSIKTGVIASA
ncbi:MAG: AIDA repeat-containing protein [Lentisphaeria bacterium]|nr:AIDA repeat-containing protein [Lentisphaeria bacterium]